MALSKIQAESVNLADTFAFTGTVSGTGLDLLATINASPAASNYEWSMDYDDYDSFLIVVERIQGGSTSGSENLDVKFKLDGTLDDGSATPYNVDNINLGSGVHRNSNNVDNMELFTSNEPNKFWSGIIQCNNFSNNSSHPTMIATLAGNDSNALATFVSSNNMQKPNKQVTDMRIAFTAGNVSIVKMKIYGVSNS